MEQKTLAIIKPHMFVDHAAVIKTVVADIILRYRNAGLRLRRIRRMDFTSPLAAEFYGEHRGKSFFDGLIAAMTSGPCLAMELIGDGAVAEVRIINGATNPLEAAPGSIRFDYARKEKGPDNAVHGSALPEKKESSDPEFHAKRELALVFDRFTVAPEIIQAVLRSIMDQ